MLSYTLNTLRVLVIRVQLKFISNFNLLVKFSCQMLSYWIFLTIHVFLTLTYFIFNSIWLDFWQLEHSVQSIKFALTKRYCVIVTLIWTIHIRGVDRISVSGGGGRGNIQQKITQQKLSKDFRKIYINFAQKIKNFPKILVKFKKIENFLFFFVRM